MIENRDITDYRILSLGYSMVAILMITSFNSWNLVLPSIMIFAGAILLFAKRLDGHILIIVGYVGIGLLTRSVLPMIMALLGLASYMILGSPALFSKETVRILFVSIIASVYLFILSLLAAYPAYRIGYYVILFVWLTIMVSLVIESLLGPVNSFSLVETVSGVLARNKILPLELFTAYYVYYSLQSKQIMMISLLLAGAAYAWSRMLGHGRATNLAVFVTVYIMLAYLTGSVDLIDIILSR
ncbi:MAG: hypothetical protein F7C36_04220 [Desulfurococcales archaeon]|nr:hypothetical protein [Desulfurococcales archaeon]